MSEKEVLSDFLVKKGGQIAHYCPACDELHYFAVDEPFKNGARWEYNGDPLKPSFSPSMLVRTGHFVPGHETKECWCSYEERFGEPAPFGCGICHYFLKNGRIEYLTDSTHKLAGMRVALVEIPARFKDYF